MSPATGVNVKLTGFDTPRGVVTVRGTVSATGWAGVFSVIRELFAERNSERGITLLPKLTALAS